MTSHGDKGFTLVTTVMGMAVGLFMLAAISSYAINGLNQVRKTDLLVAMLTLETRMISAMSSENNFSTFQLKKALQDGNIEELPTFPLFDINGAPIVIVPQPARMLADIEVGQEYYTKDLTPCAGFDDSLCVIRLEASLQMVAGKAAPTVAAGNPEWIPPGSDLERVSPYAIWAFAYRITLNPETGINTPPLGTRHLQAVQLRDHKFPLPTHYLFIDDNVGCEAGGVIAGVDAQRGVAKCIYPTNMCPGGSPLAKQVVVQDGAVGLSCAGWKSIRCPANYVIYDFRPPAFDSENPDNNNIGRCVYFGRDTAPLGTRTACPPKYNLVGTNCVLQANQKFRPIQTAGGN